MCILLLQFIFLAGVGLLFLQSQVQVAGALITAEEALQPLQNLDAADPNAGAQLAVGNQALLEVQQKIIRTVLLTAGGMLLLFILLNGLLWALSQRIIEPLSSRWRSALLAWAQFALISLAVAALGALAVYQFYGMLSTSAPDISRLAGAGKFAVAGLLLLYYALMVAFALAGRPWKQLAGQWYFAAIRRIYLSLPSLALLAGVIGTGTYFLSLTVLRGDIFWLLLASAIIIVLLALARIVWIAQVKWITGREKPKIRPEVQAAKQA